MNQICDHVEINNFTSITLLAHDSRFAQVLRGRSSEEHKMCVSIQPSKSKPNGPEKRRSSITFNDDPESGPSEGREVSTKKFGAPHERHIFLVGINIDNFYDVFM